MGKEILENYYKQLVNQQDPEIFRSILDDYVEFIEEDGNCLAVLVGMQKENNKLLEKKKELEKKVFEEIKESEEIISDIKKITNVKNLKTHKIITEDDIKNDFYYFITKYQPESYIELSKAEKKLAKKQKLWDAWNGIKSRQYNIREDRQYLEKIHGYFLRKLSENLTKVTDADNLDKKETEIKDASFPKDLRWEEIEIRFLGSEDVLVTAKGKQRETNCLAMGFQDKKSKKPNYQWEILKFLAKNEGKLSWGNNHNLTEKQVHSAKSQMSTIRKKLKKYFKINDDPFDSYRQEKTYRIKMRLISEVVNDVLDNKKPRGTEDLRDFYAEMTAN